MAPVPEGQHTLPRPLSEFLAHSALVVLGEPGAGKTTTFRDAAAAEVDAVFVPIRDFVALSPHRWSGKTLYLDGFDELRAKTPDGSTILDQLRSRLDDLGRPRFRLSCRAADWYGSADLSRLTLVAHDNHVTVLRIEALNDEDILAIAQASQPDPHAFLAEARERGVEELLRNPQTLNMLLLVVSDGRWPATRADLYHRAIEILVREHNEEHVRFQEAMITVDSVRRAAEAICAVVICSGARGIALSSVSAATDSPFVGTFPAPLKALQIASRSRLFVNDGDETVIPVHRTIAEYLAACDLTARVRAGLPVGRVLSLVTGYDGRPVADLRGVFGWFATFSDEHQRALIDRDPLAVALYGAARSLAPSDRLFLLERLGELAAKDPWFRAGHWKAPAFGELSTPEMAEPFAAILEDRAAPPSLVASVLEALSYGEPLPQLQQLLLSIVRDAGRDSFLRVVALHSLRRAVPTHASDSLLATFLEEIQSGLVDDPDRRLRGTLLRALYPRVVSADKVAQYLVSPSRHFIGEYTMFVELELLRLTTGTDILLLADAVAKLRPASRRDQFSRFFGALLVRSVTEFGDSVSTARLWTWLGLALGQHHEQVLDTQEQETVRGWLSTHTTAFRALYEHWLAKTASEDLWREQWRFWRRVPGGASGPGYGRWLLDKATVEPDDVRADFLFRQACRTLTVDRAHDAPGIDELFAFSEQHPRFVGALREEFCWEIPDWRIKQAEARHARRTRESARHRQNTLNLSTQLDSVVAGSASGTLSHLARVYFGLFVDVDRDKSPSERLVAFVGPEHVAPVLEGFTTVLARKDLPTPRMIGQLYARAQTYSITYAVLAGCDLTAHRSMDLFSQLPQSTHASALAAHVTSITGTSRSWVGWLSNERPELTAQAFAEVWEPQLKRDAEDVPGIYELLQDSSAKVAKLVTIRLLRRFPLCREETLRLLLAAALRHAVHASLSELCGRVLNNARVTRSRRLLWLATSFALMPVALSKDVAKALRGKRERIRAFVGFLFSKERGAGVLAAGLPIRQRTMLVRLVGSQFPPRDLPTTWERGGTNWEMAQVVRSLIDGLSAHAARDAGDALADLARHEHLSAWRETLAHAIAVHASNRREVTFRYPSIDSVIGTLCSGSPANASDLQALVTTELRALAEDIRHGVTDGYKAFWNVDPHGVPTTPRPEDDCRDRLLERLKTRILRNNVALEPEGRYAEEKRADIKAIHGSLNVPVEIKRHYHRDLWSAPEHQLRRLYARDPGTGARAIFLVLWFGIDFARLPKAPAGAPRTPAELVQSLTALIPAESRALTEFLVIDCARPQQYLRQRNSSRKKVG